MSNFAVAWKSIRAGAAQVNITPHKSMFLYGYPYVRRYSEGVHDPLLASALWLTNGDTAVAMVSCDLIFVPRPLVLAARDRIARATGIPASHILISATHTHSGPVVTAMLSNGDDPVVPPPDLEYLKQVEEGIVGAAVQAWQRQQPAQLSFGLADGTKLGTNRHDPAGPSLPQVPVLTARALASQQVIALLAIVSMHPTVLHEDSLLISGDFPGLARQWLQRQVLPPDCPVIFHMGASGDQSPRHVVQANTLEETARLGEILGRAVAQAMARGVVLESPGLSCDSDTIEFPLRAFPAPEIARQELQTAHRRLDALRAQNAPRTEIRTAECDWFGAQETLTLAQAAHDGRLAAAARLCMPAEVQVIAVGPQRFIGWPGEVFVEYALQVQQHHPQAHVITLSGGDLQGYLVTQQAVEKRYYEAGNALFASPLSGRLLVQRTLAMLEARAPQEHSI